VRTPATFACNADCVTPTQVLLTDTDVCFYASPFDCLRRLNRAIVLNGVPDAINIGLIYAHKTLASPPHTFHLFRCGAASKLPLVIGVQHALLRGCACGEARADPARAC
jgi:hypothetical protein